MQQRGNGASPWRWTTAVRTLLAPALYSVFFVAFFAPVLFTDSLFLSGDNQIYFYPVYCVPKTLWTPLIGAGYPLAADPTVMTWYPPAMLLAVFPNSWNVFVVSAFVMSSTFAYFYVRHLTGSTVAAIIAGLVYGLSGGLLERIPIIDLVHTAAWLPLILLCVDKVRQFSSKRWVALLAASVAMCFLAGHPQSFVYSMGIVVLYAAFLGVERWRLHWRYVAHMVLAMFLALGAICIQLLPARELTEQGLRRSLVYRAFAEEGIHPLELLNVVFPALFGDDRRFGAYFGFAEFPGEVATYAGIVPLILAIAALIAATRWRHQVLFWLSIAVLASLLAMGGHLPLARLVYYVPGYNLMRGPSRHTFEIGLSLSVLAGLGIATLQGLSRAARLRTLLAASLCLAVVAATALLVLQATSAHATIAERAVANGWESWSATPWSNQATAIPLLILGTGTAILLCWGIVPGRVTGLLVLTVIAGDLWFVGYHSLWRHDVKPASTMDMYPGLQSYQFTLMRDRQRALSMGGGLGGKESAPANQSMLWDIPNLSVYGQLAPRRLIGLVGLHSLGTVDSRVLLPNHCALDVLATRYVFVPKGLLGPRLLSGADDTLTHDGIRWLQRDMSLTMGISPNVSASLEITVPCSAVPVEQIGVVTMLVFSSELPDETPILEVTVDTLSHGEQRFELSVGKDTSEWAWEREDVRSVIRHRRAAVFSTFPSLDEKGKEFPGHHYVTYLPLKQQYRVRQLRFRWIGPPGTFLSLEKVGLIAGDRHWAVDAAYGAFNDSKRWRVSDDWPTCTVFENLRALPRAWLVAQTRTLPPEEIRTTIQRGTFPDGSGFDPRSVALTEEELSLHSEQTSCDGSAMIVGVNDSDLTICTQCSTEALLVISDIYYPGWHATIDGIPEPVVRANYVLRGVRVPAGQHVVRLRFRPRSFLWGASISCLTLLVLAALFFWSRASAGAGDRLMGLSTEVPPRH